MRPTVVQYPDTLEPMDECPFSGPQLRVPVCEAELDLIEHQRLADNSLQQLDLVGL